MKRLLLVPLLLSASVVAQAQTVLSTFSNFTPSFYSDGFDDQGWWSVAAQPGPDSLVIGPTLGGYSPTGAYDNGFIQTLGTVEDWSEFLQVELTAAQLPGNLTSTINFYVEDSLGAIALTEFSLSAFNTGAANSVGVALNLTGINASEVMFWGITGGDFDFPAAAFAMEFDHLQLTAIPEPATTAAALAGLALVLVMIRRRTTRRKNQAGLVPSS